MKYRARPQEVEAIQWVGEENCEEVFKFLGWEHPEDEQDHSVIFIPAYPNGVLELVPDMGVVNDTLEVTPGTWFTKDEKGDVKAYADEVFRDEFEPVEEGFRTETFRNGVTTSVKVVHLASGREIRLSGGVGDAHVLEKAAKDHLRQELAKGVVKTDAQLLGEASIEALRQKAQGLTTEGLKLPWV